MKTRIANPLKTRNPIARDLGTPKYRSRVVASAKTYRRQPRNRQASAAG